jgi:hypothetical protein
MPLHILIFLTQSPILKRELLHTVFEFLGPTLDATAFLITAMLNPLKLVASNLGFVPNFTLRSLRVLLAAPRHSSAHAFALDSPNRLGHRFFIFLLTDTADHCDR